jgi:septal ring factor EnvC (AmiA/AmiB activator)
MINKIQKEIYMKRCDLKLKELIEDTVMPDIIDRLDEISSDIASSKNATDEQKEEIKDLNEMRDEFNSILKDIENRELDKEECAELFQDITEMISDSEEED